MLKRRVSQAAVLALALVTSAHAQLRVSGVNPPAITSVTSGNGLGQLNDGGALYNDATTTWLAGSIPSKFAGLIQIKTRSADGSTTGNGTVLSYTIPATSSHLYGCIIHADSASVATWLSGGYVDTGDNLPMPEDQSPGSVWCPATPQPPGTYNLGGNCASACSEPMYVPFFQAHFRPIENVGVIDFGTDTYSCNEGTNKTLTAVRSGGSSGAASAIVSEDFNAQNGVLNTTSVSWTDGESGSKNISLDCSAVGVDSTMTVVLASPVGATLGTVTTATVSIADVPSGAAGKYSFLGSQTVNNNESTTFQRCGVTRTDGSTGAVSVEIIDTTVGDGVSGGTCDTPADYTISNDPLTANMANGEIGDDTDSLTFTAGNVSADCYVTCGFASPTGSWTLNSAGNTTKRVNIINTAGPSPGCTLSNYFPWSSGTFTDWGVSISGNSPTIVASPQREPGSKSLRAFIDRVNSSNPFRTEIEYVGARPEWRVGTWYGWSKYVPTSYSQSNLYNGPVIQFHDEPLDWNDPDNIRNPIWYLTIGDNNVAAAYRGKWIVYSSRAHVAANGVANSSSGMVASTVETTRVLTVGSTTVTAVPGKWYDFQLLIVPDWRRPQDGGVGYYQLYMQVDNGGYNLVASIPVGDGIGANHGLGKLLYLKDGYYKRSWEDRTTPADIISTRHMYTGPLRIGTVANGCDGDDVAPVGTQPTESVNWIMPAFLMLPWRRRRRAANDERFRKSA